MHSGCLWPSFCRIDAPPCPTPFHAFLILFISPRWICSAEALDKIGKGSGQQFYSGPEIKPVGNLLRNMQYL